MYNIMYTKGQSNLTLWFYNDDSMRGEDQQYNGTRSTCHGSLVKFEKS